jgi:CubicO group peptidase (beta-lactamase class C family)
MSPHDKIPAAAMRLLVLSYILSMSAAPEAIGQTATAPAPAFDFTGAVESAETMPRLYSLLVSWRGSLVLERYFNGHDASDVANVKSVSKSLISALVGIAIERGDIEGVDQTIGDFFPDRLADDNDAAKRKITIANLLSMQAGLETTSNRNYGRWVMSPDWVAWALEQPFVDFPGGRMIYSTGNTHLLSAILSRATGMSTLEFAREALAAPLGFQLAAWPTDPQGIYFGGNDMELTPRQMLAVGEMYINHGMFNGHRVVPEEWIETSFIPRTESKREEGRLYGYGWWIRDMAGFPTPYAWGYGGQFILIVPELDLVVVTTSSSYPGPDRRAHTRRIYRFTEFDVIAEAAHALGRPIRDRVAPPMDDIVN